MKHSILLGLFVACLSTGAFASTMVCENDRADIKATIKFPHGTGMGTYSGNGKLVVKGVGRSTLSCRYSSGITTTLTCSGRGYTLRAVTDLSHANLSYRGKFVAKLECH